MDGCTKKMVNAMSFKDYDDEEAKRLDAEIL